jgi:glycosyltransferase involved in cell wall biosynthesis
MAHNAAIYFRDDAYRTDQPAPVGRQSAGEGFLRGFLAHAEIDELVVVVDGRAQREAFEQRVASLGGRNAGLPRRWAHPGRLAPLARAGAMYRPGPNLAIWAWRRRRHGAAAWSLTGVTHTLATHYAMDQIGAFLTAPVEPWDALICTSACGRRVVERLLDGWGAWLAERLGAQRLPRPQLPVIPLGVDTAAFDPAPAARAAARHGLRQRLGIAEADLAVLYAGRLSWHVKAHPWPMYAGLEAAIRQRRLAGRVHLIEAGQHAGERTRDHFAEARAALLPSARCHHVDGADAGALRHAFWAADLFCSLADNIQETFGLTPVEAMAAGLPVIASDWDGYRETLAHGETALLVPVTLPPAAAGVLLAERHEDGLDGYDPYAGLAALATAVDVAATAEAFATLLGDPERRAAMGASGRARARALYDWSVIIPRYQELWGELAAARAAAAGTAPPPAGAAHPLRPSPFALFGHYAGRRLGPRTRLVAAAAPPLPWEQAQALRMCRLDGRPGGATPLAEELLERLRRAGPAGRGVGGLLAEVAPAARAAAALALGWLLKVGLAEILPPESPP